MFKTLSMKLAVMEPIKRSATEGLNISKALGSVQLTQKTFARGNSLMMLCRAVVGVFVFHHCDGQRTE